MSIFCASNKKGVTSINRHSLLNMCISLAYRAIKFHLQIVVDAQVKNISLTEVFC